MSDQDELDGLMASASDFGTDLSALARAGEWPPTIGRQALLDQLVRRLDGPGNRSFVLVGPSGGGKTAVVRGLVSRLAADPRFLDATVLETATASIFAGTRYLGEWQTRATRLLSLASAESPLLLYFTDLHNLPTAGRTVSSTDSLVDLLAPAVERGCVVVFGESTPAQYRLISERHPGLKRLFQVVRVPEPEPAEVRCVIEGLAAHAVGRAAARGCVVEVGEGTLDRLIDLSAQVLPGLAQPGKAAQVLDDVTGGVESELLQADEVPPRLCLDEGRVLAAIERATGMPRRLFDDAEGLDLAAARTFFEARVLGQPAAVKSVVDLITLIKAGLTDPTKPLGVLLFVGPTGVGKTELAKGLAEYIFGSASRLLRFDMSEYKDFHAFEKLIGNPQAAEGSGLVEGTLTSRVREQPFSVVLLDELEKAHPNVFDLFLQVFDDGRLSDPRGQTVDFTRTIVVMTSNLGATGAGAAALGFTAEASSDGLGAAATRALEQAFRPEFLNRIDRIVPFGPLGRDTMRTIARRELGRVLLRDGLVRRNVRVDIDESTIDVLLDRGFDQRYGARPLKRAVEELVLLPLARKLISGLETQGAPLLHVRADGAAIAVRAVQDGQSRKAQAIRAGVTAIDPLKGRRVHVSADALSTRARGLDERLDALDARLLEARFAQRKAELLEATRAPDFWDDNQRAAETLSEVHRIEQLVEAVSGARASVQKLSRGLVAASRPKAEHRLAGLAERCWQIEAHVDILGYSLGCESADDRADAFVSLTCVPGAQGGALPGVDDPVVRLAEMYGGWARSKGFEARCVHERLGPDGHVLEAVLLVEGVCVRGVLRGEEGIHEWVARAKAGQPKAQVFVRVEVDPRLDGAEHRLARSELKLHSRKVEAEGRLCPRPRRQMRLVHGPSELEVSCLTDAEPAEARAILEDRLRALLLRRGGTAAVPRVVRRYRVGHQPSVRDLERDVKVHDVEAVLAGQIDPFLRV